MASDRRGVTLLELILALSLSLVVMAAIGMALNLHLKVLQTRRSHVEEAEVARAVLRRIADDLRSAVQYQVIDFSSIEGLAEESAGAALDDIGGSTGLDDALLSGLLAGPEEPSATAAGGSTSIATTATPPSIPGLYGNQFELQIDVSRLPRVDEYQAIINPLNTGQLTDIPSDVKTVAYFLAPDTQPSAAPVYDPSAMARIQATGTAGRGLVRRQLDRQVTLWAAQNANIEQLANQGEMLAPEVTALEFRYFDGIEWLTEWDSEVRQGLPVAVAIAVEISGDPADSAETQRSLLEPLLPGETQTSSRALYQLVVHLPAAEPTSADTLRFPDETMMDETGTDTSTGSTGGNSRSGGGGGGGLGGGGGQGGGGFGGGGQGGGQGPGGNDDDSGPGGRGGR